MSGRGAGLLNELAILGEWNAICDMCGRRYKASELRKNWKGLMVCPEDWEPRHVLDFFRLPGEKIDVPFARSDPDNKFGQSTDTENFISGPTFADTTVGDPPTEGTFKVRPEPVVPEDEAPEEAFSGDFGLGFGSSF